MARPQCQISSDGNLTHVNMEGSNAASTAVILRAQKFPK